MFVYLLQTILLCREATGSFFNFLLLRLLASSLYSSTLLLSRCFEIDVTSGVGCCLLCAWVDKKSPVLGALRGGGGLILTVCVRLKWLVFFLKEPFTIFEWWLILSIFSSPCPKEKRANWGMVTVFFKTNLETANCKPNCNRNCSFNNDSELV